MNYAIISNPRTGSRSLARSFANKYKLDIGYLHSAQSVASRCLTFDELTKSRWVLHGHWHTLRNLPQICLDHILKNYQIVTVRRNHEHRFASAIIVMATANLDCQTNDIPDYILPNHVYDYVRRLESSYDVQMQIPCNTIYEFDSLYNNSSYKQFELNTKMIKNYNELSKLYYNLIEGEHYKWI